jgi:hypothetical protein
MKLCNGTSLVHLFILLIAVFSPHASAIIDMCILPPCDLVLKSRLYSKRCNTKPIRWPLLITGTPRSATVFTTDTLNAHGMQIQNDWRRPRRDGSVSWIFAFEDPHNFGPARTDGSKYEHVLHQVKNPLSSITSMCTEPVLTDELKFLQRHIGMPSSYEDVKYSSRAVVEFWVEWHEFLNDLQLPTYQIEMVDFKDIFRVAGLGKYYNETLEPDVSSKTNSREHREKFTWQEIYTIDPLLAAKAWELSHHFGYSYPEVDFDALTCLEYLPQCRKNAPKIVPPKCPPGAHPHHTNMSYVVPIPTTVNGFKGWVDSGCTEYQRANGTFVGLTGLIGEDYLLTADQMDPFLQRQIIKSQINGKLKKESGTVANSSSSTQSFDTKKQTTAADLLSDFQAVDPSNLSLIFFVTSAFVTSVAFVFFRRKFSRLEL